MINFVRTIHHYSSSHQVNCQRQEQVYEVKAGDTYIKRWKFISCSKRLKEIQLSILNWYEQNY
ncbi:unnamed protein product [Paramecium sonneborni]|uniref:Uncharacterized protein n=1 Tax=Paramecium sonneborni TaxID=65129 RepID=A0A8S1NDU8_9CILI|nr:unnamed protein product [Paramecium sonneborni]